uniref:Uncharacterized protein n=1 Tax=Meloidogyne javanica TaxID=6303 RepID=A0A915LSX0_MELJA
MDYSSDSYCDPSSEDDGFRYTDPISTSKVIRGKGEEKERSEDSEDSEASDEVDLKSSKMKVMNNKIKELTYATPQFQNQRRRGEFRSDSGQSSRTYS